MPIFEFGEYKKRNATSEQLIYINKATLFIKIKVESKKKK